MASRSVSLVRQWIDANCPAFVSLHPGRPRFIVHVNDSSEFKTERLFMAAPHLSWSASPQYDLIAAACTPVGRERFEKLADGRPETISLYNDRLIVGPNAHMLRTNNAITGGTLKERILANAALIPGLNGSNALGTGMYFGKSLEEVEVSTPITEFRKFFARLGVTWGPCEFMDFPTDNGTNTEVLAMNMYVKHGLNKMYAYQEVVGGTPRFMVMVANRPDDSVGSIYFNEFFIKYSGWPGNTLKPVRIDWGWTDPNGYTVPANPMYTSVMADVRARLQTNYQVRAGSNVLPLDTVGVLDFNWLPLVAIERNQDYFVMSKVADVSITSEAEPAYDVITVTHSAGSTVGAVPVQWYIDYANGAIADGAANASELTKAVESLAEFVEQTITYAEYPDGIMLPENIVELTTAYRDYGKAKEKACEENDFLKKEFSEGVTYQTVQTKVNGSRNTKVFYGYRDTGLNSALSLPVSSGRDVTMTLGAAVVTTMKGGIPSTSYTKDTAGEFVSAALTGATLVGGTIDTQLAFWQMSVADAQSTSAGLKETNLRTILANDAGSYGTSMAVYDFRWGSVGISGFPLYNEVDPQTGYRIAMISKAILHLIGPRFREVQQKVILKANVSKLYPTLP